MTDQRHRPASPSSWMRAALEMKADGRGYLRRPMTRVVAALRAALYDLYNKQTAHQLGVTEVDVHNYMNEVAGTFLPVEFEDGINYLTRIGQVEISDSQKDPRYRLTPEGHFAEEEARLTNPQRWWRDLKREFGTRLFWLLVGAGLVIAERVIGP